MYLAYVDDSGNSGFPPAGSQSFVLGCVLVEARRWPDVHDNLIEYRRFLRNSFGLPIRAEIKAEYLVRNAGPYLKSNPLGEDVRFQIYRGFMRLARKLDLEVFAIVIRKAEYGHVDPRPKAWEYLLQRLERFSTSSSTPLMLIHDEGDALLIRKATRKARRAGTAGSRFLKTGTLLRPARFIIDDPVIRESSSSYFIQLADLVAYAAFRCVYPPGQRIARVVPQSMWDELGAARLVKVSVKAGMPTGIVVWP